MKPLDKLPIWPSSNSSRHLKGSKKDRAVLQAKSWFDWKVYQSGDVVLPGGQWVHFDIEDNPLTASGEKHVYLWGFLVPDHGDDQFETVWADSDDQHYDGWLGFLERVGGTGRGILNW